eukprot:2706592-Amphidinium_carterae.3
MGNLSSLELKSKFMEFYNLGNLHLRHDQDDMRCCRPEQTTFRPEHCKPEGFPDSQLSDQTAA